MSNKQKSYILKRPFDFTLALFGLSLTFPLCLLIIFLIYLESGRPVFYIQERAGLEGRIFKMIKFCTMGYQKKNSLLNRFLRRTAMDELPQLINILRGEMSFVGPRPLIPVEINSEAAAKDRLLVRPGLTGIAQSYLAKNVSLQKKIRYDIWYIKNQSIILDIVLILRSFWVSLNRQWDKLKSAG